MKCPKDGLLRAHLDGELAHADGNGVADHLRDCVSCQQRLGTLSQGANEVKRALQATDSSQIDPALAYNHYLRRFGEPLEAESTGRWFATWRRPLLGGISAAIALALLVSFAPVQTWGQKILEMLRIQKVAVVPVNLAALTETGNREQQQLLARLISDNVVVTMSPGQPEPVPSADAASRLAGFSVKTFNDTSSPTSISVSNEAAFHMTLDRDRMQAVLDQAGRSDIQIPASVDGSTVAVHVPRLVRVQYGNCPESRAHSSTASAEQNAKGAAARHQSGKEFTDSSGGAPDSATVLQTCMIFIQVPSPTVSVPPNLNLPALAEAGLQIAGLSADEARSFTRTVDWSSTLVLPVPQSGSYRSVSVDGTNGTLIEVPPRGNFSGHYSLVWLKNGIIYSVDGRGSSAPALAAAASLD
jgi:anti-sigma factor RsiW